MHEPTVDDAVPPAPATSRTRTARSALYRGRRMGPAGVALVTVADDVRGARWRPLRRRSDLFNHSPTGFEWGYGGSGPADLALAILADHFARFPGDVEIAKATAKATLAIDLPLSGDGDEAAVRLHQVFKFNVIAAIPRGVMVWSLATEHVRAFLTHTGDEAGAALPFAHLGNVEPGRGIPVEVCDGCAAPLYRIDHKSRRCRTEGCPFVEVIDASGQWVVVDMVKVEAGRRSALAYLVEAGGTARTPDIATHLGCSPHVVAGLLESMGETIEPPDGGGLVRFTAAEGWSITDAGRARDSSAR